MASRLPLPPGLRDGSFTTRTAAARGIGEGRLRGPDLARPFHGIRSPDSPVSVYERAGALQLRMPDAAFFCTVTAALILGIPLPPRLARAPQLHVGMPAPMRAYRAAGSIGHKLQLGPDDVGERQGLRLTTAARTWCDLAAVLDVEDLVAAGDYIIHHRHPLAGRADLAAAADRHPARRWRARLLEALGLLDDRAESPPESVIRVTIVRAGILGLAVNHPIADAFGRVIARADLCFPVHRVIFEYQGDYHRSEPDRWRKDRTRVARLTALGWHVVEIAADELADRRMLLRLIRDTLALHPPVSRR
ncbi:hypothetical protein [Cryobacterium psychrotolerans]|uniref:hypothetical protein n=1 Tax=Cryobacterium psychrotolerans TaxID=386301 RepID=UPI000B861F51|nr:hypothetical protein [Cryobacterium psychrotolerans]TFD84163.1 hypothetical protein E3T56_10670 [Cryobacterium psychrotolerans]